MTPVEWRRGEGAAWTPARAWKRWRCFLRGHAWAGQPTTAGVVLVMCNRCTEVVTVPFVDVPDVMGAPAETPWRAWLGGEVAGERALGLLAAASGVSRGRPIGQLRREATSVPGASLDAQLWLSWGLLRYAASVSGETPAAILQRLADRHELDAMAARLVHELDEPEVSQ